MNQRGKLETIAPAFSSPALPQAPAVAEQPATVPVAHPSARAEATEQVGSDESIKIDVKRTSVGLFSLSSLMMLLPGWVTSLVGHLVMIVLLAAIVVSAEDREAALQLDAVILEATEVDDADVHIEQSFSEVEAELLNLDVAAMMKTKRSPFASAPKNCVLLPSVAPTTPPVSCLLTGVSPLAAIASMPIPSPRPSIKDTAMPSS